MKIVKKVIKFIKKVIKKMIYIVSHKFLNAILRKLLN